jgi:2-(1,2-epoxy-1,2-dihydrophenyl)acetyl-CoA isomerase
MAEQSIEVREDGPVRTLVLNRPAALNACTGAMLVQLREALELAAADSSVRCLLITGAGRAFCAGQDLSDPLVAAGQDLGHMLRDCYNPLLRCLRELPVPTVAAVNGVAAGSGANLALSCDFVLASEKASFIQAFAKIGLAPDSGGTWLLPRLVGRARALELAMLGDKLPATAAATLGLIARCLPDAELMPEALALAARLAAMPTKALVETRRAMDAAVLTGYADALAAEAELQGRLGRGADYGEGVAAFQHKRAPVFTDR